MRQGRSVIVFRGISHYVSDLVLWKVLCGCDSNARSFPRRREIVFSFGSSARCWCSDREKMRVDGGGGGGVRLDSDSA